MPQSAVAELIGDVRMESELLEASAVGGDVGGAQGCQRFQRITVRGEIADAGTDIGVELAGRGALARDRGRDGVEHGAVHLLDDGLDELVLRAEVIQHRTHRDADAVSDLADRCVREPDFGDDLDGRGDDLGSSC